MVVTTNNERMTSQTLDSLEFLLMELKDVNVRPEEWVLFGSTSLLINGALDREPGDIDVFVSKRVWGELLSHELDWQPETPKAGDPPILVSESAPTTIHLFYDWSDECVTMDVPGLLERGYVVECDKHKFRVIPVEDALWHKKMALKYGTEKVNKHIPDIERIEEWLKATNG